MILLFIGLVIYFIGLSIHFNILLLAARINSREVYCEEYDRQYNLLDKL